MNGLHSRLHFLFCLTSIRSEQLFMAYPVEGFAKIMSKIGVCWIFMLVGLSIHCSMVECICNSSHLPKWSSDMNMYDGEGNN